MPTNPKRPRGSAEARGYGRPHREERRRLIAAEPWCHDPACEEPDVGTAANPLSLEHAPEGNTVLCRSCNSKRKWQRG